MKQQNSAFSPRWTFHPSLTPAGSSAPQEPTWDSPQARLLLWTIVGTSHPGGFCLQGFPPCCKDTICASPPPSEHSWPFHLLHTWKHQNNPRGQASNRCAAINTAAHAPCAPRAPPGMHGSSPSWTPIPQSQGQPEPSREPISWTHSLHSQVDSLSTLPSLTHNSLNNYRKPQSFFVKAGLMQRKASKLFPYRPLLMEKRGAPIKLEPKMQRESWIHASCWSHALFWI